MRRKRVNSGEDAGAALLAAAKLADTAERLSPLSILRQRLAEYTALAETARLACDMVAYTLWSERSAQAARDLLPYESSADGSNKVTKFPLLIFDSQRKPLSLELVAEPAPEAAGSSDAAAAVQQPAGAPDANASPPEAKPEDPPPSEDESKLIWARSQAWSRLTSPQRYIYGSRSRP